MILKEYISTDVLVRILFIILIHAICLIYKKEFEKNINKVKETTEKLEYLDSANENIISKTINKTSDQIKINTLYRSTIHDLISIVMRFEMNDETREKEENKLKYLRELIKNTMRNNETSDTKTIDIKNDISSLISVFENICTRENIKITYSTTLNKLILGENKYYLLQSIYNIVNNSIENLKYSYKKLKIIEINAFQSKDSLKIIIKDNGTGINKNIENDIFRPLFSTKDSSTNLGIGLSIVKDYIENKLNGTILIESTEDGTIFSFNIPCTHDPNLPPPPKKVS